ncbi:MAG: glycoside hydrolase family 32 protein, partial [Gammaproteobacteria bacterium]|nr:glycoside hydrolase family 32 protein [Gammaproteobacteria bacterium]
MPSDRKSKVPHFDFPLTLDEQRKALDANPLLKRMLDARANYTDPHRPRYHYVNPEGTLNDPNGLCYWQNRWHLFYQGYPPEDTRQHWGHAVSDDLVHWQDLPYAIYPDPEDRCFSGATLVEEDRVIAMYHGTRAGNMIATSSDPLLLNWQKITNAPVIPMAVKGEVLPYNVFDPCIWKQGDYYYALSAGTTKTGPGSKHVAADFLFRSSNLEDWTYLHQFIEDDRYTRVGDDGACPYFWPIGDKHMLLFFSHTTGGQCLVGDYDVNTQKFHVTHGEKFNFGPAGPSGVHAPSATPDPSGDGSLIAIFNMNPGKPTQGWDQIMTLPRRLTLSADNGEIDTKPVEALISLRGKETVLEPFVVPANSRKDFNEFQGNSFEMVLDVQVGGTQVFDLYVLSAPDGFEYTRISIYDER